MALHRATKDEIAAAPKRGRRKGPGRHAAGVPVTDHHEPPAEPIAVEIDEPTLDADGPFELNVPAAVEMVAGPSADGAAEADEDVHAAAEDAQEAIDVVESEADAHDFEGSVDASGEDDPEVAAPDPFAALASEPERFVVVDDELEVAPAEPASPYVLPEEDLIIEEPAVIAEQTTTTAAEAFPVTIEDDAVIIDEPTVAQTPVIEEPAAAETPADDDIIEPEIDEPEDAPAADVLVAEMVTAELAPQPAPEPQQVHIHHHYHEQAEPAAPQIIIAPPPIYMDQWPTDVPVAPLPEARRPAVEERPYDEAAAITEAPLGYLPEEARPGRKKKRARAEAIAPARPAVEKEPFFTWRGKPIGAGRRDDEVPFIPAPRAIEAPAPRPRPARVSATPAGATDGTGIDTASWFDQTVYDSIERGVSDLHIRVEDDGTGARDILTARVRIDGRMRHLETIAGGDAAIIINRFKTASALSTEGSYVPEESVYEIDVDGEIRKARVALFRTANGGDALVLRLPPSGALRRLEDLNFAPHNADLVTKLLNASNRMLLIAGPMGSGKTTTAHACLQEVNTPERSIWSLEDPVERDLPSVTQLEVDEENGAGFDALLPVLVRSDYDTLFLGEIRDHATAAAGVRQAKAGRQVITTIHANDNVTALYRLIELAQDSPLSVLDSVVGVISQRLVGRRNPDWDGVNPDEKYKGRVPIHEVLTITPELVEAVMRDTPITEVQKIAEAATNGSTFLADGLRLVNAGITDREEVFRVLGA